LPEQPPTKEGLLASSNFFRLLKLPEQPPTKEGLLAEHSKEP